MGCVNNALPPQRQNHRLWGDVPALMPVTLRSVMKNGVSQRKRAGTKNDGGSWFNVARNTVTGCGSNPVRDAVKQHGSGPEWFDNGIAWHSSRSNARKAASAMIAKIPFELARHIARTYKPQPEGNVSNA